MSLRLLTMAAVVAIAAAGCDDPPAPSPHKGPAAASRPSAVVEGTPEAHTIVARDGDRILVVVDVRRNAGGRRVATAQIEVDGREAVGPVDAATVSRLDADVITVTANVPRDVSEVRLAGTFEDGGTWSRTISTALDGR